MTAALYALGRGCACHRLYENAVKQVASIYSKDPALTNVISPFSSTGRYR
jgi:hypothetical protein